MRFISEQYHEPLQIPVFTQSCSWSPNETVRGGGGGVVAISRNFFESASSCACALAAAARELASSAAFSAAISCGDLPHPANDTESRHTNAHLPIAPLLRVATTFPP